MIAEFIEFNGEWHKDCYKCKTPYGAGSRDGLKTFFSRDRWRADGLSGLCKACEVKKGRINNARRRKKYPQKTRARTMLSNAVKSGQIKRPTRCMICNKHTKIHGHHTDYSKPLDVVWLCAPCHVLAHHPHKPKALRPPKCKLTKENVLAIRTEYSRPAHNKSNAANLAEKYGTTKSTIIKIVAGLTWTAV